MIRQIVSAPTRTRRANTSHRFVVHLASADIGSASTDIADLSPIDPEDSLTSAAAPDRIARSRSSCNRVRVRDRFRVRV